MRNTIPFETRPPLKRRIPASGSPPKPKPEENLPQGWRSLARRALGPFDYQAITLPSRRPVVSTELRELARVKRPAVRDTVKEQHELALAPVDRADPFIKQRLSDLTQRYAAAKRKPLNAVPHPLANLSSQSAHDG
jgi:hypothetical protein